MKNQRKYLGDTTKTSENLVAARSIERRKNPARLQHASHLIRAKLEVCGVKGPWLRYSSNVQYDMILVWTEQRVHVAARRR